MKKWSEVIEQYRDIIGEKMMDAKRDTFNAMSGWHVAVEITKDGVVYCTELMSQNSFTRSSYEGSAYTVYKVQSWDVDELIDDENSEDELRDYELMEFSHIIDEILDEVIEERKDQESDVIPF